MYSETGLPMSHISQQAPVESDAASLLPQQDPSLFLFHENPNYNTHVSAAESKYIAASIRALYQSDGKAKITFRTYRISAA